MKKPISILLSIILLCALNTAQAQDIGEIFTDPAEPWIAEEEIDLPGGDALEPAPQMAGAPSDDDYEIYDTTLYRYRGSAAYLIIPEELGLTTIGAQAFKGNKTLESVILPEGVTAIMDEAFMNCAALQNAWLPETLLEIHQSAFAHCANLTAINFPSNLQRLEKWAFWDTGLISFCLPDSLTYIEDATAYGCPNLTEARLPAHMGRIPAGTFANSGLRTIDIPDAVTAIGDEAFRGSALQSIDLPRGLTDLGSSALSNTQISQLRLPDTLKHLGAVSNTRIEALNIPDSVTQIDEDRAFRGNTQLKTVTFPSKIDMNIGSEMFSGCTKLERIDIPEGVDKIGKGAFELCYTLREVDLPDTLTAIDANAFANCSSLQSIQIPSSVADIGADAFYNCPADLTIYCEAGSAAERYAIEHGIRRAHGDEPEVPDLPVYPLQKSAKATYYIGDVFRIVPSAEARGFTTSNDRVAHVNSAGVVTAAAAGKAKITALLTSGKKLTLTLTVADPTIPARIALDQGATVTIDKSETLQLTYSLAPEKAESAVTWKCGGKAVKVSPTGLVTPQAVGKATVTATTVKGKKSAKIKIIVVDKHAPTGVSISAESSEVSLNGTLQLTPVAVAEVEPAITTYTWKTSNKKVATVSNTGLVTPHKVGQAKITVITANKKKGEFTIRVVEAPSDRLDLFPYLRTPLAETAAKLGLKEWEPSDPDVGGWETTYKNDCVSMTVSNESCAVVPTPVEAISLTSDPKGLYCIDGFCLGMAETGIDAAMKGKPWKLRYTTKQYATRISVYFNGAYEIVFYSEGGRVTAINAYYNPWDA